MIRNYILIALRNISRNLSYTFINVIGLSLGITGSLVLFLLISFLTSFDNYHPDGDRIYRVVTAHEERQDFTPGVPPPFPDAIKSELTGLESVLFISARWRALISIDHSGERKKFEEENNLAYTDSTYFRFFDRRVVSGSASLNKPNEAVISKKLSEKFFGMEDPIGKTVRLDNAEEYTITGVLEDYPDNTSFPFDLLMSFETIKKSKLDEGWGSISSDDQCYVVLEAGANPNHINEQLSEFIKKHDNAVESKSKRQWLQPLSDIRHDSRFSNYAHRTAPKEAIWAMGVLVAFLIVTACINFINLTTAVSVRRSKEVGIRKVLGSQRTQLVMQCLSETGVITFFAIIISVGFAELALINLNSFLGFNLHIVLSRPSLWVFLFSTWLLVSLISGLYPAVLLSGFSPVQALKNKITNSATGGLTLRRGLVVFQFVISQFLIVGTIILLTQMDYLQSKDLGFSREAIITVPIPERDSVNKKMLLRDRVRQLPGVQQVSLCSTPPSSGSVSNTDFQIDGVEGNPITQVKRIDAEYLSLFDIELVSGRNFDDVDTANAWIVNERLVSQVGLTPENILGRNLRMWGHELPVIGVAKDFHTVSLENDLEPVVMAKFPHDYYNLAVKVKPGQVNTTIASVEDLWSDQYPDFLFSYQFLDEQIAQFYEGEEKMSVLLIIFSSIAVGIGCLGLYGLISFIAAQKEKEIGVRKVLGATTQQIMSIFSREFATMVIIAFTVAAPLSAYVMSLWLENFAYRVPLGWTMFASGIIVTMVIAFLTIGYKSLRAAAANPVDALRGE